MNTRLLFLSLSLPWFCRDMVFFDDWDLNLRDVGRLGVKGVHTPSGALTKTTWVGWSNGSIEA